MRTWNVYFGIDFRYDYIKNKYENISKLLFGDIDSLMYENKTEDVYKDFSSNKEMFDFSSYSTKTKYYDYSNKLVIGKSEKSKLWCCNYRICRNEAKDVFAFGR